MKALSLLFVIVCSQSSFANMITTEFECKQVKTKFPKLLRTMCPHSFLKHEVPVVLGSEFFENGPNRTESTPFEGSREICPRKAYYICIPEKLKGCALEKAVTAKLEELAKNPVDKMEPQIVAMEQEKLQKIGMCALEAAARRNVQRAGDEMFRNRMGVSKSLFGDVPQEREAKSPYNHEVDNVPASAAGK